MQEIIINGEDKDLPAMAIFTVDIDEVDESHYPKIFVEDGFEIFKKQIKDNLNSRVYDMSIKSNRDDMKSDAFKITKYKTKLIAHCDTELKKAEDYPKLIKKLKKDITTFCEDLQEEFRKPLTEFENRDKERVAMHEAQISALESMIVNVYPTVESMEIMLGLANKYNLDETCQEYLSRYTQAKTKAVEFLTSKIEALKKYEAEQLELAKLRKEAEERAQAEREKEIALEATRKAEEAARIEQERLKTEAIQREAKLIAEKEAAEKFALQEKERLIREAKEAEEKARIDKENAEKKAKLDAEIAKKKAEEDKQKAIEDERKKAAQEKALEEARLAKITEVERVKSENIAHRKKINNEIITKMASHSISEEMAKLIITLAVKGELGNLTVKY